MTKQDLTWLVPALMQIPVTLAMMGVGFNFNDLYSTVMFLYAYHFIMMAFKGFFQFFFHQDDEVACWPIRIFNFVTRVILQIWAFITVFCFVWQNDHNSSKKTVISGILILTIELVLVGIMVMKIFEKLGAGMSKCFRPQIKPTNSRTPRDNKEPNEDKDGLLTSNTHNNTDTENDTES